MFRVNRVVMPQITGSSSVSRSIMKRSKDLPVISRLLKPGCVLFFKGKQEKSAVIESLVRCVADLNSGFSVNTAIKKVMDREHGMSTVLDTGLSIPHARIEEIKDFSAALGLIPEGLQDPAQPGITVKAMFLFLSPDDPQFFKKHLQLLSALSALFQPALINRLVSLNGGQQVIDAIISTE